MYSTRTEDGKLLRKSKEDTQNSGKVVIKSVLQKTFMKTLVSVGNPINGFEKKEHRKRSLLLSSKFLWCAQIIEDGWRLIRYSESGFLGIKPLARFK